MNTGKFTDGMLRADSLADRFDNSPSTAYNYDGKTLANKEFKMLSLAYDVMKERGRKLRGDEDLEDVVNKHIGLEM